MGTFLRCACGEHLTIAKVKKSSWSYCVSKQKDLQYVLRVGRLLAEYWWLKEYWLQVVYFYKKNTLLHIVQQYSEVLLYYKALLRVGVQGNNYSEYSGERES